MRAYPLSQLPCTLQFLLVRIFLQRRTQLAEAGAYRVVNLVVAHPQHEAADEFGVYFLGELHLGVAGLLGHQRLNFGAGSSGERRGRRDLGRRAMPTR